MNRRQNEIYINGLRWSSAYSNVAIGGRQSSTVWSQHQWPWIVDMIFSRHQRTWSPTYPTAPLVVVNCQLHKPYTNGPDLQLIPTAPIFAVSRDLLKSKPIDLGDLQPISTAVNPQLDLQPTSLAVNRQLLAAYTKVATPVQTVAHKSNLSSNISGIWIGVTGMIKIKVDVGRRNVQLIV